jgi:putative spermidine/putrescine transport system substrate-binding protein
VATVSAFTGMPFKEAQYHLDQSWDHLETLKPNILTIYEAPATVMMVAQGQADLGAVEYSKAIYPYTVAGAAIDMMFPKEGAFAGINCLTYVKGAPEPELGAAFINRMLDPDVQHGLAAATYTAPSISGLTFKPDEIKYMAYPESKMDDMQLFACDWKYINPLRPGLLEKTNLILAS